MIGERRAWHLGPWILRSYCCRGDALLACRGVCTQKTRLLLLSILRPTYIVEFVTTDILSGTAVEKMRSVLGVCVDCA